MKILSIKETCQRLGVSRTQHWKMVCGGRFPAAVSIDGKRKGHPEHEVDAWIEERIAERNSGTAA